MKTLIERMGDRVPIDIVIIRANMFVDVAIYRWGASDNPRGIESKRFFFEQERVKDADGAVKVHAVILQLRLQLIHRPAVAVAADERQFSE